MHHSRNTHIVTAGDLVPGTFVSWYWDAHSGLWVDTTNRQAPGGAWAASKYRIRGMDIRVVTAANAYRSGIHINIFLLPDPAHPEIVRVLKEGFQTPVQSVHWSGDESMDAGIMYRISREGLIATDIIDFAISYEGNP